MAAALHPRRGSHLRTPRLDPADLLGAEVVALGRSLVDAENKKLAHEIAKRIGAAKALFDQLQPEEIASRRAQIHNTPEGRWVDLMVTAATDGTVEAMTAAAAAMPESTLFVRCPACGEERLPLRAQAVRTTNEGPGDGEIYRDVVYVARGLSCPVCGLELRSTAEIRNAGIQQQFTRREYMSLEERYLSNYEPGYGSD